MNDEIPERLILYVTIQSILQNLTIRYILIIHLVADARLLRLEFNDSDKTMPGLTPGKTSPKKKNLMFARSVIDSLLKDSDQKKITPDQVVIILDALAGSEDPALVTRFPAIMAVCIRKGIEINSQALFSRYWDSSPKRRNMEKLLLISAWLLHRENITVPENLEKIIEPLKSKNRALFSSDTIQLSSGVRVSITNMHKTLKKYTFDSSDDKAIKTVAGARPSRQLSIYLDRLFSPKQKELIFKKLNEESLTKTEREYYSRVVRKKLKAIAFSEIREIADTLTGK